MSVDATVALLVRIPILSRLDPAQISEIARHAERCIFRPGQFITKAGAPGSGAYLLVSGNAADVMRLEQPVPTGSLIGELAMLVAHTYGASIVANERVHCLLITREAMHTQMMADPALAEHFSQHIRQRLQKMTHGLDRIDHVLANRDRESAVRPEIAGQHYSGGVLDRILRTS